jgi:predicted nucleotidyltransferase
MRMIQNPISERRALAQEIASRFAGLPEVEAIAIGGSTASGLAGPASDIDLYVYRTEEIALATRAHLIEPQASRIELDNRSAEPADAWIERASGIAVDLIYRHPDWIEEQLDRVLQRHEAAVGYSTAFWHNVRHALPLFDRSGWFARLQLQAVQPYPAALASAIIAKNHPLLRNTIFSWLNQLTQAVRSNDPIVVNQKLAKLLASYFDVLFAFNHMTHPGEKHLFALVASCPKAPPAIEARVRALLKAADDELLRQANALIDDLDQLLAVGE